MNKWMVVYVIIIFPFFTFGQPKDPVYKVSWQSLENIAFKKKFLKEFEVDVMFPRFTDELKMLVGKTIEVTGFVIPIEPRADWVALSAYPNASCFFCGAASPASVMTIRFKGRKPKYRIDDFRTFKGTLKLNSSDIHEFYYILNEAVEVK